MSKELFISSSPHETKVAVLEDDQLVEVYFQRETDVGLVGGIYKGRVSRVLPGMQSAFVDIGLGRDAFLYVSDFFEDSEEYDRVFTEAEVRVAKLAEQNAAVAAPAVMPETIPQESSAAGEPVTEQASEVPVSGDAVEAPQVMPSQGGPAPVSSATAPTPPPEAHAPVASATAGPVASAERPAYHRHEHRGRRHRRRGRGFGESRFGSKAPFQGRGRERPEAAGEATTPSFEILPGESLARYSHPTLGGPPAPGGAPVSERQTGQGSAPALVEGASQSAARASAAHEPSSPPATEGLPSEAVGKSENSPPRDEASSLEVTGESFEDSSEVSALSTGSTEIEEGAARADTLLESALLEGDLRVAPLNFQPDSPAHGVALEGGAAPDQLAPGAGDTEQPEAPAASIPAIPAGRSRPDLKEDEGVGQVAAPREARDVTGPEVRDALPGFAAAQTSQSDYSTSLHQKPAAGPGQAEGMAAQPHRPSESVGATYTLNEPYQRPRFAPRRARGGRDRFGRGGPRPEGAGFRPLRSGNVQPLQIAELLKEGQEILVQIAKEPLGTKGARITSHIALPGRYLVYMPTIDHIGVSRKIASEEERLRLRNIILENRGSLSGGFIVRTAGAGRSEEDLKADLKFLFNLWSEIRSRADQSKAPALLHRDLTLVQRILRDTLSPDFKCVRVDNETEYESVVDFVNRFQPSLVGHVKLYTRDTPMFEEFGLQDDLDKALKPKVWLKSGGYVVINQTEALVAIDVNTGKYVGRTNRLEDTIVKTNIDAVKEIVRQIRLRDLGGIIVIDFIDMDDRRNRLKVVQALEEALRSDRAPTKILSFNEFGLVALTRKRVKQSLERTLCEPCPYCTAAGWVKSVSTVCYEILAEAKKMAQQVEGDVLTLRVNPEVAKALKSRDGVLLSELESMTQKDVIVKSDLTVHQERFEIF